MKLLRLTAMAVLAMVALAAAADKTHVVKKGESIGGIAYKYNISVDELLLHNPQAATGLRPGMEILVPDKKGSTYSSAPAATADPAPAVETKADRTPAPAATVDPVPEKEVSAAFAVHVAAIPSVARDTTQAPSHILQHFIEDGESLSDEWEDYGDYYVDSTVRTNILVLLPLTKSTSRTENYVDFYRGMVLAARSSRPSDGLQVGIYTYDIAGDSASIDVIAHRASDQDVAAVIMPKNEVQIAQISGIAADNGAYAFNFFSVKDTAYIDNPFALQTYINQPLMYSAAIDYLLTEYAGYTPVILSPAKGKKEKEPFVKALTERYERFGLNVLTVKYEEVLTPRALSSLPQGDKYVFIPMSGSREVFANLTEALLTYIMEHPLDAALFGYPDWTAFVGEAADNLHLLGAEIYTRFYLDNADPRLHQLRRDYEHWYGQDMLEVMPSMAVLGYDAGTMLIEWIQDSRGHIDEFLDGEQLYQGLQSSFRFGHGADYAGFVNTSLYFVKFKPDGTKQVIVR